MQCPECKGKGVAPVMLSWGVFLGDEYGLEERTCRICKGRKVVQQIDTTCADCDVKITVTIPKGEELGERVCQDCGGN